MIRLSLLVAVILIATGCDTVGTAGVPNRTGVDVSTLSHDTDALVGTWVLVTVTPSGECMGEGCSDTRSAAEAEMMAEIAFSDDGTAVFAINGNVFADGPFEVRPLEFDNGTQTEEPYLIIDDQSFLFGVDGDHLYLDDRYVDGPLLEFERITYVAL